MNNDEWRKMFGVGIGLNEIQFLFYQIYVTFSVCATIIYIISSAGVFG